MSVPVARRVHVHECGMTLRTTAARPQMFLATTARSDVFLVCVVIHALVCSALTWAFALLSPQVPPLRRDCRRWGVGLFELDVYYCRNARDRTGLNRVLVLGGVWRGAVHRFDVCCTVRVRRARDR